LYIDLFVSPVASVVLVLDFLYHAPGWLWRTCLHGPNPRVLWHQRRLRAIRAAAAKAAQEKAPPRGSRGSLTAKADSKQPAHQQRQKQQQQQQQQEAMANRRRSYGPAANPPASKDGGQGRKGSMVDRRSAAHDQHSELPKGSGRGSPEATTISGAQNSEAVSTKYASLVPGLGSSSCCHLHWTGPDATHPHNSCLCIYVISELALCATTRVPLDPPMYLAVQQQPEAVESPCFGLAALPSKLLAMLHMLVGSVLRSLRSTNTTNWQPECAPARPSMGPSLSRCAVTGKDGRS